MVLPVLATSSTIMIDLPCISSLEMSVVIGDPSGCAGFNLICVSTNFFCEIPSKLFAEFLQICTHYC